MNAIGEIKNIAPPAVKVPPQLQQGLDAIGGVQRFLPGAKPSAAPVTKKPPPGPVVASISEDDEFPTEVPYKTDWTGLSLFATTPYGFRYFINKTPYQFWLPINPSNLSISTQFPNNITPTLYGVVEERSEIKIYRISITGTTGIAPKYTCGAINGGVKEGTNSNSSSRKTASDGTAAGLLNKAAPLDFTGFTQNFLSPVANALGDFTRSILGNPPQSGFSNENSGYAAFHRFYKFLWTYQKLVGSGGKAEFSPVKKTNEIKLEFLNYKDNCRYHISPSNFALIRTADSPYLYNYSIDMVGYSLLPLEETAPSFDVQARMADLGLDGVSSQSLKSMANEVAGSTKGLIGSVKRLF